MKKMNLNVAEQYLLKHYDNQLVFLLLQSMDNGEPLTSFSDEFILRLLEIGDEQTINLLMASPILLSEEVVVSLIRNNDVKMLQKFVTGCAGHSPYLLQDKTLIALIELGNGELIDAYLSYWRDEALKGDEIRHYLQEREIWDSYKKYLS